MIAPTAEVKDDICTTWLILLSNLQLPLLSNVTTSTRLMSRRGTCMGTRCHRDMMTYTQHPCSCPICLP